MSDLVVHNGPSIVAEMAIELARQHLATLEQLAKAMGRPAARYLDDIELGAAMDESMGRDARDLGDTNNT